MEINNLREDETGRKRYHFAPFYSFRWLTSCSALTRSSFLCFCLIGKHIHDEDRAGNGNGNGATMFELIMLKLNETGDEK